MAKRRTKVSARGIIPTPGHRVKAMIVGAGVKLGDLAEAAGISKAGLSAHIAGRRRNPQTQLRIFLAFLQLTRRQMKMVDFWGKLVAKEVA